MPAYIIAEIQVTDPTAYDGYRPLAAASIARFGGRFAVRRASSICSKAGPSRNGSLSSNSRMQIPPAAGTARRNTKAR